MESSRRLSCPISDGEELHEQLRADAAEKYCRDLAHRHYENFQVVSFLLPAFLRQHFCNIYAFCRIADDLADESPNSACAVERLLEWRQGLRHCYSGNPSHPVFEALQHTVRRFEIPPEPFERLIEAFLQDQRKSRYDSWNELLGYCRNSADPVGHLVLYLFGYRDPERRRLADFTCTALQLTNFWQDVSRDLDKGRIYIPREEMARFGCPESDILSRTPSPAFITTLRTLADRTDLLFQRGRRLTSLLKGRPRLYVSLFADCGQLLLRRLEAVGFDVFLKRPVLTSLDKLRLLVRRLARPWNHD